MLLYNNSGRNNTLNLLNLGAVIKKKNKLKTKRLFI